MHSPIQVLIEDNPRYLQAHLPSIRLITVPLVYRKTFRKGYGLHTGNSSVFALAPSALQTSQFFTTAESATHTFIGLHRDRGYSFLYNRRYDRPILYLLHRWQECGLARSRRLGLEAVLRPYLSISVTESRVSVLVSVSDI